MKEKINGNYSRAVEGPLSFTKGHAVQGVILKTLFIPKAYGHSLPHRKTFFHEAVAVLHSPFWAAGGVGREGAGMQSQKIHTKP